MITTWSAGNPADNMDEEILVELGDQICRHPWWNARATLAMTLIERLGVNPPANVLDAGCGWGVTLEELERRGYRPAGLDISPEILKKLDKEYRELFQADLTQPLPDGSRTFAAVMALDVIEHVDDDRGLVANLAKLVQPGGFLIVSVPALPELFTEFDAIQGHRRRYTPETFRNAFEGSGLDLRQVFWWGSWLVPVLRRQRSRPKAVAGESVSETYRRYLSVPKWPATVLIKAAFAFEKHLALAGRLNVGTSLFAVAQRPASS